MRIIKLVLAMLPCAALLCSCTVKNSAPGRIQITAADGSAVSKTVYIPLEGESSSLNVRSEEDVDIFYKQASGTYEDWFTISDIRREAPGEYTVSYTAKALGNTLDLRSGSLCFVSPDNYLGAFLSIRQGYQKIWETDFSGNGLAVEPGKSWTSETMDGISSIQDAWLSFNARADAVGENAGQFPLVVSLDGGASFMDINRSSYQLDVQASDTFGADNFFKLHIYNGGRVFSSESTVSFSVPAELSSVIRIGSVSIYEIPVESNGITGISESDE